MGVTLDDVARHSGVSRATASRALNGLAGVRPDVRERVRAAAESLGYRPNRAAKNLASGRSSVIGLVMPSDDLHEDPYCASVVSSVAAAADRHDEGLMLVMSRHEPSRAVADTIRDGLVDGLLVSIVALGQSWLEDLLDTDFPTVIIGSHTGRTDVHTIEVDDHDSVVALVAHLHDQGCERIAHITGPPIRHDAVARLAGFREGHRRLGLAVDESLIEPGDYYAEMGRAAMETLLERRPDGVVCANDLTARGAASAILAAGLRIPDDVAVVGFDGTAADFEPSITSAVQPFDAMCELAVTTLVHLVEGREAPLRQSLPADLRIAASSSRS